MTDTPETEFDFNAWLATGTVNEETVVINLDPQAAAECARIAAEIDTLSTDSEDDAPLLDDPAREGELLRRWEEAYARYQAASSTWTVRASSTEDEEAAFEAVPALDMPIKPLDKAGSKANQDWQKKMRKHLEETREQDLLREEFLTATCVVRVEYGTGHVQTSVTPEQIRALRLRPGGQKHYELLTGAVNRATEGRVEAPRPKSLENSGSDQD